MKKKVFKYELSPKSSSNVFEMPRGSQLLSMQIQNGNPCLWILVESESTDLVWREFIIVGTGHFLPEDKPFTFIDTFQLYNGSLAFHVFEVFGK